MDNMRIGVLGSGDIAHRVSSALMGQDGIELFSVASRHYGNAIRLAREFGYTKAVETYDEVIEDPDVDIVYIGLLHPLHHLYAKKCLEAGKPVFCEKPFTMNAKQAEALLNGFEEKGLFIAEALWTRFLPARRFVENVLASGVIGEVRLIDVNMICNIVHRDRLIIPEMGGGALLDLGVYALNFVDMFFGDETAEIHSLGTMHPNGVDDTDAVIMRYPDGKLAVCKISMSGSGDARGVIYGTRGRIEVSDVMNFKEVKVYDGAGHAVDAFSLADGMTGYEYQFQACRNALLHGKIELEAMPHTATLSLMRAYDRLREAWGLKYPCE